MQPYGGLCFGRRTEGVQGASGKPPACVVERQFGRKKCPAGGSDAPTTARMVGLPPRGGGVLSFEAKESTKESTRHGDYGKKASIAHFASGTRNVARAIAGELSPALVRAPVLAFFRRQNGRAFFPSLPIAARLRRRFGGGEGQIARVGLLPRWQPLLQD